MSDKSIRKDGNWEINGIIVSNEQMRQSMSSSASMAAGFDYEVTPADVRTNEEINEGLEGLVDIMVAAPGMLTGAGGAAKIAHSLGKAAIKTSGKKLIRKGVRKGVTKPTIKVKDSTGPKSEQNYSILNMSKSDFENHLIDSGLSVKSISTKKGNIDVFSNAEGKKVYTTRGFGTKSGDKNGPTAEMFGADGQRKAKIRILGGDQ